MLSLSFLQFPDVVYEFLFSVLENKVFPKCKGIVLNVFVNPSDWSNKECPRSFPSFNELLPGLKAYLKGFGSSDIVEPKHLPMDIFLSLDFFNLFKVLIKGISQLPSSECFWSQKYWSFDILYVLSTNCPHVKFSS